MERIDEPPEEFETLEELIERFKRDEHSVPFTPEQLKFLGEFPEIYWKAVLARKKKERKAASDGIDNSMCYI